MSYRNTTDARDTSYHGRLRHIQGAPFGGRHRGAWIAHAVGLTLGALSRVQGMGTTSWHMRFSFTPQGRAGAVFVPVKIGSPLLAIVSSSRDWVSRHPAGLTLNYCASTFRTEDNVRMKMRHDAGIMLHATLEIQGRWRIPALARSARLR